MNYQVLKESLAPALDNLTQQLSNYNLDNIPVTIICLPRHGHATTKVALESIYQYSNPEKFIMIYLDINAPQEVNDYLQEMTQTKTNFFQIRINEYVSRQTARLTVLDLIPTKYTVFIDNNMLVTEGWLDNLVAAAENDQAAVVSPLIVMQGGNIHFSGSKIVRTKGKCIRKQTTKACPLTKNLKNVKPAKIKIEFGESHCCLIETDKFKDEADQIFNEGLHNSHTMAVATYQILKKYQCKMIIEPKSLVCILPISFGYDMPWIFHSFTDLAYFKKSYELHPIIMGESSSSILNNLRWHRKNLLYVLMSIIHGKNHLTRSDLLRMDEIPAYIDGYDFPLPKDTVSKVNEIIVPYVEENYPLYVPHLDMWLNDIDGIVSDITRKSRELEIRSKEIQRTLNKQRKV